MKANLLEALTQVQDFRAARGQRYSLSTTYTDLRYSVGLQETVVLEEDSSRMRQDNAPANLSIRGY